MPFDRRHDRHATSFYYLCSRMEKNNDKKRGFGSGKGKFDPSKKLSRNFSKKSTASEGSETGSSDTDKPKRTAKPNFSKFDKRTKEDKFQKKDKSSKFEKPKKSFSKKSAKAEPAKRPSKNDLVRLNKYIANSGVCSRREADKLIEQGLITVNGEVITELGTKIKFGDKVQYEGKYLRGEQHVYLLMNKPKDFITTSKDPQGRKTVMDLVGSKCKERVYPVGRLDRNTTGLLMLTNDGDLASKLTHPKNEIGKLYQVETDIPVKPEDLDALMTGITLEDGDAKADNAAYAGGKNIIGVELHSGKNRIVRRMFAELGYEVKKLDRVMFAGLTKKDIPRGKWRFLTDKEIAYLKML